MSAFTGIEACVFDAYGTLFDVHSAVAQHKARVGGDAADRLSLVWRTKQLEYTWLRSLMGAYVDFWQVTQDALDYAIESCGAGAEVRDDLMNAYLALDCYPEVKATLTAIRERGLKTAILSNGSPRMLEAAVQSAGLAALLDGVYSVDELGVFKPDGRVYQLACDRLGLEPRHISFQSSNAWDASGAAHHGMTVAWVNRFGQAPERLPGKVSAQLQSLDGLLDLLPRA